MVNSGSIVGSSLMVDSGSTAGSGSMAGFLGLRREDMGDGKSIDTKVGLVDVLLVGATPPESEQVKLTCRVSITLFFDGMLIRKILVDSV